MNSVSEAMYYGVPMLVLPVLNDQPINAAQVERLAIGKQGRAFPTTAGRLRRLAMGALADQDIRRRAAEMSQTVRAAPGVTEATRQLEALLTDGVGPSV